MFVSQSNQFNHKINEFYDDDLLAFSSTEQKQRIQFIDWCVCVCVVFVYRFGVCVCVYIDIWHSYGVVEC